MTHMVFIHIPDSYVCLIARLAYLQRSSAVGWVSLPCFSCSIPPLLPLAVACACSLALAALLLRSCFSRIWWCYFVNVRFCRQSSRMAHQLTVYLRSFLVIWFIQLYLNRRMPWIPFSISWLECGRLLQSNRWLTALYLYRILMRLSKRHSRWFASACCQSARGSSHQIAWIGPQFLGDLSRLLFIHRDWWSRSSKHTDLDSSLHFQQSEDFHSVFWQLQWS